MTFGPNPPARLSAAKLACARGAVLVVLAAKGPMPARAIAAALAGQGVTRGAVALALADLEHRFSVVAIAGKGWGLPPPPAPELV